MLCPECKHSRDSNGPCDVCGYFDDQQLVNPGYRDQSASYFSTIFHDFPHGSIKLSTYGYQSQSQVAEESVSQQIPPALVRRITRAFSILKSHCHILGLPSSVFEQACGFTREHMIAHFLDAEKETDSAEPLMDESMIKDEEQTERRKYVLFASNSDMAAVLFYFSRDCFSTPIPLRSFIDKLNIPYTNFSQSLRHVRTILPIPAKSIPIETYLSQIIMVLPIDHPSSFLKMTQFLLVLLDDIVDGKNPTIMASALSLVALHSFDPPFKSNPFHLRQRLFLANASNQAKVHSERRLSQKTVTRRRQSPPEYTFSRSLSNGVCNFSGKDVTTEMLSAIIPVSKSSVARRVAQINHSLFLIAQEEFPIALETEKDFRRGKKWIMEALTGYSAFQPSSPDSDRSPFFSIQTSIHPA
ncbi:hypothetical protein BLNAU_3792 [Blattamonas nauphoetae]|uniref:Rho-GAP domain-containing protein n=1 Tax=Blattamonas nauphoetae TaxID=2049346 RepID=A0ABQ9YC59_9EUKA|nr:hypothetical protein BLNAU_3792 [Blattamonas nauphoetae]